MGQHFVKAQESFFIHGLREVLKSGLVFGNRFVLG